ncbi:MAG: BsaA family SipW-dependent biofilm matrix protein [Bacillota bacterium]|nr:hypothetical protein [Candidatus Fermentithermobacillaceae bacterium]
MKRSIPIGVLVVALVALFVVGGTMAWFTAQASETNEFKTGTVKIQVMEEVDEELDNWAPGEWRDKEIRVKNTGSLPAVIKAELVLTWLEWDDVNQRWAETDLPVDNVILRINERDWRKDRSVPGHVYFYKLRFGGWDALQPGDVTEPLIKAVGLDAFKTDNQYQGKKLRIEVKADALQAGDISAAIDAWNIDVDFLSEELKMDLSELMNH